MPKRRTSDLTMDRLRELARAGAEVTIARLRAEIRAIEQTFPELANPRKRRRVMARAAKRSREMSAAARRAASKRMKKYWAERRKATAKLK
jgi:hypothetical protein